MTAYVSDKANAHTPAVSYGLNGNLKTVYAIVNVTAALTTADTFQFFTLPKGARVTGSKLKVATALDTNGSPTLSLDIGDGTTAARYFSADTTARAGGVVSMTATGGVFFSNTADTVVTGAVHANAATGATSGTIELSMDYIVEGFAD